MDTKRYQLLFISNQVNGRYYVAAHSCPNGWCHGETGHCHYMGSGRGIRAALRKYGRDHFLKVVIAEVDSAEELFALEAKVVTPEVVKLNRCYNRTAGGRGGATPQTAESLRKRSASLKAAYASGTRVPWQLNKRLPGWTQERHAKIQATWEAKRKAA